MLELKGIKKDYPAGDGKVEALKGIDLSFRKSEFVSILGPSGCGKTTMLNIIGGLDQYTEGDLIINGRSTKDFKDRDWDTYRNHSIGFVFQSYNLIPHQSVLQNVELALTLSGVSKAERRRRAKEALQRVGLETQLNKKPGEMSGGQMQRVAIARAIVNDPDIILADEPTGALDTETSVQVMDILKEIANDRLVIMVTHNPELAERYSTRIIRMLDGNITDDSMPYTEEYAEPVKQEENGKRKKHEKKPSMSFFTAFGLSLKNLFTKKGRTALTSFAGSIGIIGIALIYAVSQGTTTYIDTVQEDTLSSYPLTLEAKHMDMGELLETFINAANTQNEHDRDAVYTNAVVYNMLNAFNSLEASENDLHSFKEYLEKELKKNGSDFEQAVSGVQYSYNLDLKVYTKGEDGSIVLSDTEKLMQEMFAEYFGMNSANSDQSAESSSGSQSNSMSMMSFGTAANSMWQEILPSKDGKLINPLLEKQYDVIYGSWPNDYNEVVLVLDENNELNDMTLYALGLKTKEDIDAIMRAAVSGEQIEVDTQKWTYEEICDMEFRAVLNANCFVKDSATGLYNDISVSDAGRQYLYDNGIPIKVVGIIRPNEDAVSSMLTGSIAYTKKLTEYVIEHSSETDVAKEQVVNSMVDIFTGLPFKENTGNLTPEKKAEEFKAYINKLDVNAKAQIYVDIMSIPSDEEVIAYIGQTTGALSRAEMEQMLLQIIAQQMNADAAQVEEYIAGMSDDDMKAMFSQFAAEQYRTQYAAAVSAQMANIPAEHKVAMLTAAMEGYTLEQYEKYYDNVLTFSDSTFENNLDILGYIDLDKPTMINLYASSFENKDVIEEVIAKYNSKVDEASKITYTDYVGLMMSSITTVINAITYVLIAFVAVSLIVSSIMIGVITLISVQERTKEIGILRAIGASKRNVSSMFNAETVIIGFTSGALGVLVTYLLCIPINIILHAVTGIPILSAQLPIPVAIILVLISMLLTVFSGIIPSRSAAKKDPVVALRTE